MADVVGRAGRTAPGTDNPRGWERTPTLGHPSPRPPKGAGLWIRGVLVLGGLVLFAAVCWALVALLLMAVFL